MYYWLADVQKKKKMKNKRAPACSPACFLFGFGCPWSPAKKNRFTAELGEMDALAKSCRMKGESEHHYARKVRTLLTYVS